MSRHFRRESSSDDDRRRRYDSHKKYKKTERIDKKKETSRHHRHRQQQPPKPKPKNRKPDDFEARTVYQLSMPAAQKVFDWRNNVFAINDLEGALKYLMKFNVELARKILKDIDEAKTQNNEEKTNPET